MTMVHGADQRRVPDRQQAEEITASAQRQHPRGDKMSPSSRPSMARLLSLATICLFYLITNSSDNQESNSPSLSRKLFPRIGSVQAAAQSPILSSVYSSSFLSASSSSPLLDQSLPSTPIINQSPSNNKRDLSSRASESISQYQSASESVCQVKNGESVAIVEIEESKGSDSSQSTNPGVLPISGSVELGEIELKIESETHKYFKIENKSLTLTRPLDRDAVLKEVSCSFSNLKLGDLDADDDKELTLASRRESEQNSSQILHQPISSIYLQISCMDRRKNLQTRQRKVIIPVLVKVLDLNDNAPKFSKSLYSVQVNELTPVGTVILDQILAIDLDSAANGQIEYSLVGPSQQVSPADSMTTTSNVPNRSPQRLMQRVVAQQTTTQASLASTQQSHNTPTFAPIQTTTVDSSKPVTTTTSTAASQTTARPEQTARKKSEPTINLNNEPIVNGPLEEEESEEESDEELLAALDAQSRQQYSNASTTMHGLEVDGRTRSSMGGEEDEEEDEATRRPVSKNAAGQRGRRRKRRRTARSLATIAMEALTKQDLPWTNLLANSGQQQTELPEPTGPDDSFDSSLDYFGLEVSGQNPGRAMLRLKKALDYESRRVHSVRVMAIDRAASKSERLASYATIVVKVLDGDDQAPVFVLDQGGCATGSLPQTTTPSSMLSSQASSRSNGQLEDNNNNVANNGASSDDSTSSEFWDTLGLDDNPLDIGRGQRAKSASSNRKTASRTNADRSQAYDYLCLSSNSGNPYQQQQQQQQQKGGEAAATAEYYATVMSGDSDYVLRVAPQAVKARDRDQLNAPIRYTFLNGTPESYANYFQINPLDASIKQIQPVEHSLIEQFQMWIQAQEQSDNKLSTLAKLSIQVVASDKSPPVLVPNSYAGQVEENSPVGTRVSRAPASDEQRYLHIQVVDPDRPTTRDASHGGKMPATSYEFETTSDSFKVDSEGFVYVSKAGLDRDEPQQAVHMFQVTAREVGLVSSRSVSSPISLNVSLLDLNDNAPILMNSTLLPVRMQANSRGGTQLLTQVKALDKDLPGDHSRVHFSLRHVSNMGQERFRIDEESGKIETLGKFVAGEQFSLTVQVQDELQRQSQGILDVLVIPGANTAGPQFVIDGNERDNSRGYAIDVNEAVPVHSVVLQVRAVDPENDQITYSLIEQGSSGPHQGSDFSINSRTGVISVAAKLDREEISAYNLLVQARDSGGLATTRPVQVTITDSNDNNPVFDAKSYAFEIEEGARNVSLGRVHASDSDAGENGQVHYSLEAMDSTQASLFEIDEQSGEIRLMQEALDYEKRRLYSLLVIARDRGEMPRSSSVSVQIKVRDIQDELPYFERYYQEVWLDENSPAGQRVASVQARDPDSRAQISYILLAGDTSSFAIDPQTGIISTQQGLDYEQARIMTLLVGTNESFSSGSFDLVGASNSLNEAIQNEAGNQQQTLERSPIVRVDMHVNDLNDNAPQFEWPNESALLPVRVQDSAPLGSQVIQLSARDRDASIPNNQIRFELVKEEQQQKQDKSFSTRDDESSTQQVTSERCARLFHVDSSSGSITVSSDLRRDPQLSECQLVVRVHDLPVDRRQQLGSQATTTVFIDHLADVSASALIGFADLKYTIELSENVPVNSLVKVIPIVNKFKNGNSFPVACELLQPGNEAGKFQVKMNEQADCELRTSGPLDAETRQKFTLNLKLNTLAGGAESKLTAQVQVNVLDENDNRPTFVPVARYAQLTQQRYLAAVAADAPSESQVIQLRASDSDLSQPNNLISYELESASSTETETGPAKPVDPSEQDLNLPSAAVVAAAASSKFKIDPVDGIVRTAQSIEDIPASRLPIILRILAKDNPSDSSASLESTAELVVNLMDDRHRIGLVLKDVPTKRALEHREQLMAILQERTGLIPGLERMESLKTQKTNSSLALSYQVESDPSGTDVWFYLIEPGTLRIVASDDSRLRATLFDARAQNSLADVINQNLGFSKIRVRLPYALSNSSGLGRGGREGSILSSLMRAGNSANDRLAPALILIALFIAIFTCVVVIYQCGSISNLASQLGPGNSTSAKQSHLHSDLGSFPASQMNTFQPSGALDHFFAAGLYGQGAQPPPPPASSQFGTMDNKSSCAGQYDVYGQTRLNQFGGGQAANAAAAAAAAKEYETQMLKMSVLFDDNQSFDERNLQDRPLVNQNLMA